MLEAVRGFHTLADTRIPPASILEITNNNNIQRKELQVGFWIVILLAVGMVTPPCDKLSGQLPAGLFLALSLLSPVELSRIMNSWDVPPLPSANIHSILPIALFLRRTWCHVDLGWLTWLRTFCS
ncbi:hypothetical protein BO79DRAFT_252739 [Aspergillus costaricaensis CBS 115574]|uniref:Uncharacterized protein n=1 Tax=Aspergillus costaricaensis CBS 115574 TaxID=1448317 RepID=A0ACD1IN85_9EURO|nr:hypothetical protein BO79DRAFT_252739 [Aspergillus costaricaensis CBS 115574]RAK91217.1 hypothetical protein BO79DRAFT_252739 [Aspergillus costaricaensis CBS 115574]